MPVCEFKYSGWIRAQHAEVVRDATCRMCLLERDCGAKVSRDGKVVFVSGRGAGSHRCPQYPYDHRLLAFLKELWNRDFTSWEMSEDVALRNS